MAQQVQVFHNLTQVLNQIPTLILSMGFHLFSCLDPQKWEEMVTDRISNYHLPIDIAEWHFCFVQMFHVLGDQNPASGF